VIVPLVSAPDLPATLYAEVAGLDARGRDVARLVLLRPGDGLTEDAVLEIAHRFILSGARLADRNKRILGPIVESGVAPPGGLDWHGLQVPEGTWVAAIRVTDEETAHALASTRRVVLHPMVEAGQQEATKRGDEVDERTLSKVLQAALQPLLDAAVRAEIRLRRLETALVRDSFADALRARGDAGVRELERRKRLLERVDPVGAAVIAPRAPLVPTHPTLGALAHDAPDEAPPPDPTDPDPVGREIRRKRPPSVRPVGVSLRVKR
jgi:hypothetical protein